MLSRSGRAFKEWDGKDREIRVEGSRSNERRERKIGCWKRKEKKKKKGKRKNAAKDEKV